MEHAEACTFTEKYTECALESHTTNQPTKKKPTKKYKSKKKHIQREQEMKNHQQIIYSHAFPCRKSKHTSKSRHPLHAYFVGYCLLTAEALNLIDILGYDTV